MRDKLCGFRLSSSLKNLLGRGRYLLQSMVHARCRCAACRGTFFPILLLLVADSASGRIVGMKMFSTVDGIDSIFARIPETFRGTLKKAKIIPVTIAAQHTILLSALEACRDVYGTDFEEEKLLQADEVLNRSCNSCQRRGISFVCPPVNRAMTGTKLSPNPIPIRLVVGRPTL